MTREEYSKWRKEQMALPLVELIAKPNCNFDCPEGKKFVCVESWCKFCGGNTTFLPGEKRERVELEITTIEEFEKAEKLRDENNSFFDTKLGCRKPRHLRSKACLSYMCNKYEKIAGG